MTAPPPSARLSARLAVSASQIKSWLSCERAWYLKSVARAPDDDTAGGQYLLQGDLFDEAVQLWSAKMAVDVDDLIANVRRKPGLRGAALTTSDEKWADLAERAQRMLRAAVPLLPAPKTARVQHRYRVLVPGFEDAGGVVFTGATDLRQPGFVWDTKTTSDRGPGRGVDAKTPPRCFTAEDGAKPLADDPQAKLYAWAEFQGNPDLVYCRCRWVYISKASPTAPTAWAVDHTFGRDEVLAWFDATVRPIISQMLALHLTSAIMLDAGLAAANHDSCARCFVRFSCSPFTGLQAHTQSTTNEEGQPTMAIDLKALRARQTQSTAPIGGPPPDLESALRASLLVAEAAAVSGNTQDDRRADVAINRPAAAEPSLATFVASPAEFVIASAVGPDVPHQKRGRGRPRKPVPTTAEAIIADASAQPTPPPDAELRALGDAIADAVAAFNAALRARGVYL